MHKIDFMCMSITWYVVGSIKKFCEMRNLMETMQYREMHALVVSFLFEKFPLFSSF